MKLMWLACLPLAALALASEAEGQDRARYEKMMEAFGGVGVHATTPDELRRAVSEAMASGKPTLVNAAMWLFFAAVAALSLPLVMALVRRLLGWG